MPLGSAHRGIISACASNPFSLFAPLPRESERESPGTRLCQYRLYCSNIVAYACAIVETHSHLPVTRRQILLTRVHVGTVIILWQHCRGPWRSIDGSLAIDGIFGDI